ncbi:MAG: FixH family protein [Gammaproteobacteria bacterium]|nr:FixH family protein [Gammaproteobacteria bacterium]
MNILLTIPLGIFAQLLLFVLLQRVFRLHAKAAALMVGLSVLALYIPYAILVWPGADVVAMHVAIYLVTAYALGLIFGHRESRMDDVRGSRPGFHWGPTLIVAFFVVLVLFDSVLVVIATQGLPEPIARLLLPATDRQREITSAFPGVVDNDFQKKEALYNAYLEQVRRQHERGWVVHKGWLSAAHAGQTAKFQVTVNDRDGKAVTGAVVQGGFLRAADTRLDQRFALAETAPGVYQSALTLPLPGVWNLVLEIRRGEELHEVRAATTVADADH